MLTSERARLDFFNTLFTKVVSFGFLFLQGIIIARWLGAETKGAHAKLQASCQLLVVLLEIGISHAITYFVASKKLSAGQALGFSLTYASLVFSILIAIGFALWFTPFSTFFYPSGLNGSFFAIYLVFSVLAEILRFQVVAILTGHILFRSINRWERYFALLRVLIFGYFFLSLTIENSLIRLDYVLAADLTVNVLGLISYFVIYAGQIGKPPSFNFEGRKLISSVAQFAGLIYFSNIINYLLIRVDYWIVEYFLGPEELGFYSVSVGVCLGITFIPMTMATVLFPHLSRETDEAKEKLFSIYSRLNFTVTLILSILIFSFSKFLVPAIFGETYEPSASSLQLLIWGYLIASFRYLLGVYLKVTNALRLRIESDLVALISCFVLSILATPIFGISGTVGAFTGANFIALLYVLYRGRDLLGHWTGYFMLRRADLRYFFNIDS